jgi:hypothetical protein
MHVLPPRFTKIRHFGLLAAGNVNTKLVRAQTLLESTNPKAVTALESIKNRPDSWLDNALAEANDTTNDTAICPRCRNGKMIRTYLKPGNIIPFQKKRPDSS